MARAPEVIAAPDVTATPEVMAAEEALERLFRLTAGRRMHARQAAAVGSVLTRAGYAVLRCAAEAREISLGDLARECSMDPAAAGRQVKDLEGDGLLVKSPAPGDGRVTVVHLTPRGLAVYRRVVAVRTEHMAKVLSDWSSADRVALVRLVDRLVEALRTVPFHPSDADAGPS